MIKEVSGTTRPAASFEHDINVRVSFVFRVAFEFLSTPIAYHDAILSRARRRPEHRREIMAGVVASNFGAGGIVDDDVERHDGPVIAADPDASALAALIFDFELQGRGLGAGGAELLFGDRELSVHGACLSPWRRRHGDEKRGSQVARHQKTPWKHAMPSPSPQHHRIAISEVLDLRPRLRTSTS